MQTPRLKVTVTSLPGEPSFTMPINATEAEIIREIKDRFPKRKGVEYEWFSQPITIKDRDDIVLVLRERITALEEELTGEKKKSRTLWSGLRKLKRLLIINTAKNCFMERSHPEIEIAPLNQDTREAIKRIDGELIRLSLAELEKSLEVKDELKRIWEEYEMAELMKGE